MSTDEILKTALSPGFDKTRLAKKNPNPEVNLAQSEVVQDLQPTSTARSSSILEQPKELGGRIGADPTRYGDWEKNGRCIDF